MFPGNISFLWNYSVLQKNIQYSWHLVLSYGCLFFFIFSWLCCNPPALQFENPWVMFFHLFKISCPDHSLSVLMLIISNQSVCCLLSVLNNHPSTDVLPWNATSDNDFNSSHVGPWSYMLKPQMWAPSSQPEPLTVTRLIHWITKIPSSPVQMSGHF